jgi:SAM-dependent methyltransferase
VLDVPCGNARLALELAALGMKVSGLDASRELLAEGRRRAAERGLELELVNGDMRALPWRAELDAAFCAGNSFGYFDDEGNRAFLEAVASTLVPGGRFWLEYPLALELVRGRAALRDWRILGERIVLTEAALDPAEPRRLETSYTFVDLARPGGALETRHASYRVYELRELQALLESAGFTSLEALGQDQQRAFGPDSSELWLRARRA